VTLVSPDARHSQLVAGSRMLLTWTWASERMVMGNTTNVELYGDGCSGCGGGSLACLGFLS
jgi:hypothetical protein